MHSVVCSTLSYKMLASISPDHPRWPWKKKTLCYLPIFKRTGRIAPTATPVKPAPSSAAHLGGGIFSWLILEENLCNTRKGPIGHPMKERTPMATWSLHDCRTWGHYPIWVMAHFPRGTGNQRQGSGGLPNWCVIWLRIHPFGWF